MCYFDIPDQRCEVMNVTEKKKKKYCYKCPSRCSELTEYMKRYIDLIENAETPVQRSDMIAECLYYLRARKED